MNSEFVKGFIKEASTVLSRWMAKNPKSYSKILGRKADWLANKTPKELANKEYQIAKNISGKTGKNAFRLSGKSFPAISQGDALGLRPHLPRPRSAGDYTSERVYQNLGRHGHSKRPMGAKDSRGRIKETIAKNPKVRSNATRRSLVSERGVGDLTLGSPSEFKKKRSLRLRVSNQKAENIVWYREKQRLRARYNLTLSKFKNKFIPEKEYQSEIDKLIERRDAYRKMQKGRN